MNRSKLEEDLTFITQEDVEIQIIIYALVGDANSVKKLDVKANDLPDILSLFKRSIKEKLIDNKNYSVLPLSSADERGNCYYEYDLELPEDLSVLNKVIGNDNIENFDFRAENISDINSLIIVISSGNNHISLYKKLTPVEKIIGRGSYLLWKADQRFEKFEDNLLRISPSFQMIRINGTIIVLKIELLEKSFGFVDVITREALSGVKAIQEMNIVSNIETLQELVGDVKFARKLTKIARNSPVIVKAVPNVEIIRFTKEHPALKGKIRYNADESQITLDTKISKDLFIKLLNDDFLTSELTRSYYESLAKDDVL